MKSSFVKSMFLFICAVVLFSLLMSNFLMGQQRTDTRQRKLEDFTAFDLLNSWRDQLIYSSPLPPRKSIALDKIEVTPTPDIRKILEIQKETPYTHARPIRFPIRKETVYVPSPPPRSVD